MYHRCGDLFGLLSLSESWVSSSNKSLLGQKERDWVRKEKREGKREGEGRESGEKEAWDKGKKNGESEKKKETEAFEGNEKVDLDKIHFNV